MIRPTATGDTPTLIELARETGVFKPAEIVALREVLDDYHAVNRDLGHLALTLEEGGEILGFAYYAPASMTDRAWYLYWIAVAPKRQGKGLGSDLLRHVEDDVRHRNGRLFLIETSSLPHYDPTRRFYLKHGYEVGAVLRDFYADGDDLVIFRKRLAP